MKKYNKYKNIKSVYAGIKFDSKKEATRYAELLLLVKAKLISDLQIQPSFLLCDKVKWEGTTLRKRVYKADFRYKDAHGNVIVEDSKGVRTPLYKLKRHLFLTLYPEFVFIET